MRELSGLPRETNGALTEIWNDFYHAKKNRERETYTRQGGACASIQGAVVRTEVMND